MDARIREIFELPYKDLCTYWQHYWTRCVEKLTDKDNVSFKVVGPRMLLKDLVEELEGHGLSNQENISLFIPSINYNNYLLYKKFKIDFPDLLGVFQFSDFCPDFDNEICQNLRALFNDCMKKGDKEVSAIYSLLIFLFDKIFYQLKDKKIKKFILQHAAKKTYAYIEQYKKQ